MKVELPQEQKDEKALCPAWRKALLDAHAMLERLAAHCAKPRDWVCEQLGFGSTARFKAVERALDKTP